MHAIRSKARHLAYKDKANPFGRRSSAPRRDSARRGDLESGNAGPLDRDNGPPISTQAQDFGQEKNVYAQDNHSENCVVAGIETRRGDQSRFENPVPRHGYTMPAEAGSSDSSPTEQSRVPTELSRESDRPLTGNMAAAEAVPVVEKPKRQKRWEALFKRKSENHEDTEQTEYSESEKSKQKFTFMGQLKATVFGSWINVLLIAAPVGIALNYANVNKVIVFVVNFIAIIPLAGMLSYATEEIALRVGETLGGLLNASFGNAVELIVAILALVKNEILIVKTSLIGSILSNLLLVLGMCFVAGGFNRLEQHFNVVVAQTAASLLALSAGSLIIPTAFARWGDARSPDSVAPISRGSAIILLAVYGFYLFFQLKSHAGMYNAPSEKTPKRQRAKINDGAVQRGIATMGAGSAASSGGRVNQSNLVQKQPGDEEDDDEKETPQLSLVGAIVTLACSTALVALCAEFMVSSIGALTATGGISEEFVGLILLPIVGNAAEHATAVTVAIKDKMDLAIGVAVGSSMQIALLVIPLSVVLGWIIGTDPVMTLEFDGFQIALLFVSVLLVNYLIQDGKSHWLEGVLLIATYILIALAAWFYPAHGVAG